jgi:hypothetical protein
MTRMLTALAALALLLPSVAAAQAPETNAPPGNSAIDEYLETVPDATGNGRPRPRHEGGGESGVLTAAQRRELDKLGPDGRQLAAVVDATGPARARGTPARSGGGAAVPSTGEVAGAQARSPLRAALASAVGPSDGEGMGALLPVVLLAGLLGVTAIAVLRRRPLR